MKKKQIIFLLLILAIMVYSGCLEATAAVPGVSKSEVFEYSYVLYWSSSDTSESPPSNYLDLNETKTIQLKITEVTGTKINLEKIDSLKNGSQKQQSGFIDINTGNVQISFGSLIVASDINAQDKLYPSGGDAIISETISRTYTSGQRETNHFISQTNEPDHNQMVEIYYDKLKGVAVSYYFETQETSNGHTTSTQEYLTCTNVDTWIVAPLPSYTISAPTITPTSYPTAASTQSAFPTSQDQTPSQPSNLIPIAVLVVVIIIVVVVALLLVRGRGRRRKSRVDEEFAQYLKPKKP